MRDDKGRQLVAAVADGFTHIVLWQGAAFLVLLLLVWENEFMDLQASWAGLPARPPDVVRGCMSSAGVLLAAVITIGHTYVQHRNIVRGMLTICCYCHKIRLNHQVWQRVEEYIGKHSLALFSHGACPECYEKAKRGELEEAGAAG